MIKMRPIADEIADILTPRGNLGVVVNNKLYQLQPLVPFDVVMEMARELNAEDRKKLLQFLNSEDIFIHNGIIYILQYGLNFEGRLKEIFSIYGQYLNTLLGDKSILIKLYDTIPIEDIVNLVQDKVLFVMKKLANSPKRVLAAIRYLPDYEVRFENRVYRFPGCMVAIAIDEQLHPDNPEVIVDGFNYEHPFVFRGTYKLGQKICMGSFYNSKDKRLYNKLRFANNINYLIKQAIQILVSGYHRNVSPANGHLTSSKYDKFLVERR